MDLITLALAKKYTNEQIDNMNIDAGLITESPTEEDEDE